MIEPTNVCNLRCPVCPTGCGDFDSVVKGSMSFQQFKAIIDQVKDFLKEVRLWGYGEPFLAPEIMKMINYLGENKIFIVIHTNGGALTKKTMDQFKKNYRMWISFSIDGLTQKTYDSYRVGGSLKKVLANLSYLVHLKQKYNLNNVRIIWQFLIMKTNEYEVLQAKDFAENIGVDALILKTIGMNKKHFRYNDFMPKNKTYWRQKQKDINFKICEFIDPGQPTVSWNGDVVPCCYDYFKKYIVGNVFKEDLLNIWNNSKYRKFRQNYEKRKNNMCITSCKFTKKSKVWIKEFNFSINQ